MTLQRCSTDRVIAGVIVAISDPRDLIGTLDNDLKIFAIACTRVARSVGLLRYPCIPFPMASLVAVVCILFAAAAAAAAAVFGAVLL